jgi:excisionase family DNA binding protein
MLDIEGLKFYTLKETCDLLHISLATARRYIADGKLPARKIGAAWYVLDREIKEAALKGTGNAAKAWAKEQPPAAPVRPLPKTTGNA